MTEFLYIVSGILTAALFLTWLYGTLAAWNRKRKGRNANQLADACVISVGNVVMGGSGKTPVVIALARLLIGQGFSVTVASRGYKGGWETSGGLVSDGRKLLTGAAEAGDEPYLIAQKLLPEGVSVVVGADRFRALQRLETLPQIVLLDDGFQHCRLARDLDIVLLPVRKPLWRQLLPPPLGLLREFAATVAKADMTLITKSESFATVYIDRFTKAWRRRGAEPQLLKTKPGRVINSLGKTLPPGRVGLVSALADNELFRITMENLGFTSLYHRMKTDHKAFSAVEIEKLLSGTKEPIVTTEKDFVKMSGLTENHLKRLYVLEIAADLEAIPGFVDGLLARIRKRLAKGNP